MTDENNNIQETKITSPWLNTEQAADYLGTTRSTLADYRTKKNGPPYYKVGGIIRYKQADLDAWIECGRVQCG
jgi:excisionase family DNA binding protein